MVPGTQVRVVNSYAATSDFVSVSVLSRVDLPTEGKPMRATRASPNLATSNPSPPPEPPPPDCSIKRSDLSLASLALSVPK